MAITDGKRTPDHVFFGWDPAIRGKSLTGIILDEFSSLKAGKPVKKDYNTIGVRFIHGDNIAKVYTYRIRKGAKVHLGQELVTPFVESNTHGQTNFKKVVVVVRIDKTPQDTGPFKYQTITEKASPL